MLNVKMIIIQLCHQIHILKIAIQLSVKCIKNYMNAVFGILKPITGDKFHENSNRLIIKYIQI